MIRGAHALLGSCGVWAWQAMRATPLPVHPLRAAMWNVTADYDQVRACGVLYAV